MYTISYERTGIPVRIGDEVVTIHKLVWTNRPDFNDGFSPNMGISKIHETGELVITATKAMMEAPISVIQFCAAHELGHLRHGHLDRKERQFDRIRSNELEADQFAVSLVGLDLAIDALRWLQKQLLLSFSLPGVIEIEDRICNLKEKGL